jgi:DNA-binding NtrC family response regulator
MSNQPSVLLIEDDISVAKLIIRYIDEEPYQFEHRDNGTDGLQYIEEKLPDVVILDLNLPDANGLEILKTVYKKQIPTEVIIITGHGNVNIAVEAMQYGAYDFLEKPFNGERLLVSVKNAIEHHRLTGIVEELEDLNRSRFQSFIGRSTPMQSVYSTIENAAPSKATVFILGESGTGKELCAEAIHKLSNRKDSPFVPLNCAAIPKDLVESEIFGHVKGAFTGAMKDRQGAVTRADHGTLFLDEIGEMNIELQAKLLRFLQTGEYQRVGSSSTESVDVRIVCATNRDPLEEVKAGRFREDLYYRLNVIPIILPALRDRDNDINQIARHFLNLFNKEENKDFESFDDNVEKYFLNYSWPGNVRQLQNVVRNIVVLNTGKCITFDMLPAEIKDNIKKVDIKEQNPNDKQTQAEPDNESMSLHDIKPLWLIEKEAITKAINTCDGNIPKAAAMLDVSPSTIYRKKQSWDTKE